MIKNKIKEINALQAYFYINKEANETSGFEKN